MKSYSCDNGHNEIWFDRGCCPICDMMKEWNADINDFNTLVDNFNTLTDDFNALVNEQNQN